MIPDCILDSITKLVRKFIWAKDNNGKGLHLVGWKIITNPKSEGGLGIKDLKHMKNALLSKHALELMNDGDKIWIKLMVSKYGRIDPWQVSTLKKVSWTFRGLMYSVRSVKNSITQVNVINSNHVLHDPWLFDTPLIMMPTFINMQYDMTTMLIKDLRSNYHWNWTLVCELFPPSLTAVIEEKQVHEDEDRVRWKLKKKTEGKSITAAIYEDCRYKDSNPQWIGWKKLWKLKIIPKIKIFLWKMLHGRLPTSQYLQSLGIGTSDLCSLCNSTLETSYHLFVECRVTQLVWLRIRNEGFLQSWNLFNQDLTQGGWLEGTNLGYLNNESNAGELISCTLWAIWISRCNHLFR
ncbi:hypothetical protein J5N97_016929 [Dioscorea zingiberensis]|uniref:Reverse transcriptase zinc-binding domain-containing protein n=1 Tax=Dioscorea zingiberensis TaxID=325984 RepID=A0A9D5CLB8_9LILI|nr:hypothetical protein J5N97_016929 [Dioscorea zingiberensis]